MRSALLCGAHIHVNGETIPAVFGWPAIHVREGADKKSKKVPDLETVILDCGCHSDEEVKALGIQVGSVVTFDADLTMLNDRYFVGRGLDNRMGGFMIAEVARRLKESKGTATVFATIHCQSRYKKK